MGKNKEKTGEVKALKLNNGQLRLLVEWLQERTPGMPLMLHGSKARARNRFFTIVQPRLKELEEGRVEIAEKYSKKDKEGKARLKEDKSYDIDEDKQEVLNKELTDLFAEEYLIDILPSNKETLKEIKEMVLNLEREFNMQDGALYSVICDSFEESL